MTLNSSGPISLAGTTTGQSIEIELGGGGSTTISLNDSNVRTLAGVASGAITMPTNFYGKSNRVAISYTFTSSTNNAALNVSSISGYIAGKSDITITVNSGVYLWSSSITVSGLTLSGGTSGDTISLVNNGYIIGQGGYHFPVPSPATSGGPALSLAYPISLTNNSYVAGGGGVGAGPYGGGFGAGGGYGCPPTGSPQNGGAIGAAGGPGNSLPSVGWGGGGGRILPGVGGASVSVTVPPTSPPATQQSFGLGGGAGGSGNTNKAVRGQSSTSGAGGSGNSAGSPGPSGPSGGGGWGAAGGGGGTAGGNAITLNGNTVTYVVTGNVWGAVS